MSPPRLFCMNARIKYLIAGQNQARTNTQKNLRLSYSRRLPTITCIACLQNCMLLHSTKCTCTMLQEATKALSEQRAEMQSLVCITHTSIHAQVLTLQTHQPPHNCSIAKNQESQRDTLMGEVAKMKQTEVESKRTNKVCLPFNWNSLRPDGFGRAPRPAL